MPGIHSKADLTGQVIALAGLLQAAHLVDRLSTTGEYDQRQLKPLIHSLFEFNPDTTPQVYGGITGVESGLGLLDELFSPGGESNNQEVIRYTFGMLQLERKLSRRSEILSVLRSRLEHAALQYEHFSSDDHHICKILSAIYQDTISKFNYRIQVTGSLIHLQNPANADIIRTSLFAGIRSAILWRQCGGRRWKLILQRRKISRCVRSLLSETG